jgi:hypothetical protein
VVVINFCSISPTFSCCPQVRYNNSRVTKSVVLDTGNEFFYKACASTHVICKCSTALKSL